MWILLITKLTCEVSPPKLSIFWATPWPEDRYVKQQCELDEDGEIIKCPTNQRFAHNKAGGWLEPNWNGARRIRYSDHDVRVFPHEFTILDSGKLKFYIDNEMYDLVPEGVAGERIATDVKVITEFSGSMRWWTAATTPRRAWSPWEST